ncbi:AlpA family transcriptional regulator [Aliiroseovarius sp.]|uniref:helix-turn-helix transcriptional regulator n=1 Tax=Aliiroseovarius sp. TaxID=1872442 RepID=UPI00261D4C48|nr:AlpA family transcriptional regulator [Aliiroseovarius sp.]
MTQKLLRRPEVEALTGLSRTSIYRMMDEGEFPRPVRLGKRAVAWREADLAEWLNGLTTTAA